MSKKNDNDAANLLKLIQQLSSLSCGIDPMIYYSVDQFSNRSGVGINKAREAQNHIVQSNKDHSPRGKGVLASGKTWYEAMKEVG